MRAAAVLFVAAVAVALGGAAPAAPNPGATGGPSYVDYTQPAKAFDGDPATYWQGSYNTDLSGAAAPFTASSWSLTYGFAQLRLVTAARVDYAADARFVAQDAKLLCSLDGETFAEVASVPSAQHASVALAATCRWVTLRMAPPGTGYSPAVAELSFTSTQAGAAPRFQNPTGIVAVGDSITQGAYAPFGWPTLLPIWRPIPVSNQGSSGDTTEQMLARLPAALATGAQMVLVMGGTNDCQFGWPTTRSLAAVQAMAAQAAAAGREPVLVGPIPRSNVPETCLLALRAALADYAAGAGLRFVDPWPAVDASLTVDGVHPSARGAFVLARVVAHALGWQFPGE